MATQDVSLTVNGKEVVLPCEVQTLYNKDGSVSAVVLRTTGAAILQAAGKPDTNFLRRLERAPSEGWDKHTVMYVKDGDKFVTYPDN